MHPALRQHVAPPSIRAGRYIAVGLLTGLSGILFTFALVRFIDVRAQTARSQADIESRDHRDHVRARTLAASQARVLDDTQRALDQYAYLGYPRWVAAHPDQACPDALSAVTAYLPDASALDPWGMAYRFQCNGEQLTVSSAGPDRTYGTSDDILGGR